MIDLSSLNQNQLTAVNWDDGSMLVLAGPGSGKTKVLTVRIARLLSNSAGKRFKILGLTFTNKAAAEMKERIENLVSNASDRTLLTNFHSFAADVLRQHGHHIGLKPDFTILTQDEDKQSILEEALEKVFTTQTDSKLTSERLLPLITRLIENDISPENALSTLKKSNFDEPNIIAQAYTHYRQLMIERSVLDFPALVSEALKLLQTHDGVKRQIQRIYPYICVDEFQDTNLSQYKLLKCIVNSDTKNLFVVADDDQIIYQWNGASPERLTSLQNDYGMTLIQLPENYRCPAEVVDLANKLIVHNFSRSPNKANLTANKKHSSDQIIKLYKFDTFQSEASWVASHIAARSIAERSKCVVLARTKKLLEEVVSALGNQGVQGYLANRKNAFESQSLLWLHSMLRLTNARSSREYLHAVCKAFFSLEGIDLNIKDIVSQAAVTDGDYLRGWANSALQSTGLSDVTVAMIRTSVSKLSERLDFWSFIKEAFQWLDQLPEVASDINGVFDEYTIEKKTWESLVTEICSHYGKEEVTLHLLLQELDLRSKTPPMPKDGVPCFTIHASKGMEFDHVYFIGLVEDQLPSWAAIKKGDDSREMQEERRNCFVAITRVKETLILSYSENIFGYKKNPSRFLTEMGIGRVISV
jgi:DNA helicase-2/ATP-dependent DNA helicase PcrA